MRALLFALPLLLAGCSVFEGDEHPRACTDQYVSYTVDVRLPDGAPADSVSITAENERTGQVYGPCNGIIADGVGCGESGTYTVYTDAQESATSRAGDDVTVRGTRGDLAFEAAFRFRTDGCHVDKLAGPDTVTLR